MTARFGAALAFAALACAPLSASAQDGGAPADAAARVADAGDAGVADAATLTADGATDGAVPWADASEVTAAPPGLPSFLDTTDRRIRDERPPPSPEQLAALVEMEAEVGRFSQAGTGFRDSVTAIVRREYLRQRRARDQFYARQILAEEELQNEARLRAIRLFEQFVERYPDDPTYTPDAMFRLGELYFERSALEFQAEFEAAQAARDRGEEPPETADSANFTPTIDLYNRLVARFPAYRRIDGVYYLIGYCLKEMGKDREAVAAWLTLVCANHFTYDPSSFEPPPVAPDAEEGDGGTADAAHPAATFERDAAVAANLPFVDPYSECEPVREGADFVSETWFRVGEHHFDDYANPHGLDLAISAYGRILRDPNDRNYSLALYKVAWTYYRASRYPEAVRTFAQLVQWSDEERQRTGRAGSELRPEAVQYLGISFAYDDWNENQTPDPFENGPTGIQRVQDAELLPQDREWTPEVYFKLGDVYFDEAKYPEAIAVWELALQRWPMHFRAPEITNQIARAHQRQNHFEEAIAARSRLGQYAEGPWPDANLDHPTELRLALELAENALIGTAVHYHQQAQLLRRQCVEQQNPALCTQAQENYRLAADAYRSYLQQHPNNPQAYELQYNLADALYWSENYEEAAREYASVRDSNLDDAHLSESARLVVESLKRLTEAQEQAGALQIRSEPPEPSPGPPPTVSPIAMPEMVQRLAQAREVYIARVDERHDSENVREAYDYNNSLLLYFYGYWPQARERFRRIFDERCDGADADETGRVAWLNLQNIAVKLGDNDEVERLANELRTRNCTFAGTGQSRNIDCTVPENRDEPECYAGEVLVAVQYRRAVDVYRQAEAANGAEQQRLYEQAATMLVRAVNDNPNDRQAPVALEQAATALERTSRFESAARLYQRIIDEVAPRRDDNPEEQAKLDAIVANAYFRLAFNSNRFFDFERAVENYRLLADSPRFATTQNPVVRERRQDAMINAAVILENLQQYDRAADYYRRAAAATTDAEVQRKAYYQIAEMAFKQRNWNTALTAMNDFITRYRSNREAGELVVQAQWRVAQVRLAQNRQREYRTALEAVVAEFARSGQPAGSLAAEYAAHARFLMVDTGSSDFESFAVNPGRSGTMDAFVNKLKQQIDTGANRAKTIADGYNPVAEYRRPAWTIAAFARQGRIYEILARAVLNTTVTMPDDLQAQLRRVSADQREEIRIQIEDRVHQVLDERVRPIECFAVIRYVLASRLAKSSAIDNEYTQLAVDRLQAYGEERVAECVAQQQATDASFGAYQAGEFARALRGQTMSVTEGQVPPAVDTEGN